MASARAWWGTVRSRRRSTGDITNAPRAAAPAWSPPLDGSTDGPPNPAWITRALDEAGLYGPSVDIALGGAEPMVDQWESGTQVPTADQLDALCQLTEKKMSYFYQPTPRVVGRACARGQQHSRPVYEDELEHLGLQPPL